MLRTTEPAPSRAFGPAERSRPGGRTRVLLVDDHTLFRAGLRDILEAEGDFAVVAEAGDSESAVARAAETRPDVVLLDVEIPGEKAATTLCRILRVSPASRVIVVSMYDEPRLVQDLLVLGVRGYLLKRITREELIAAVRTVHADDGRCVLSISRESLAQVHGAAASPLSHREQQVLLLVADAMSNAQIATRLSITEGTVKRHLGNIFGKLGAVSRIDAVNKAVSASLISLPQQRFHLMRGSA
jgi:DNA-binding NarL/FixJ family response regulator